MPFIIYAIDHEGKEKIREKLRERHREHLSSIGDALLYSGALLDDNQNIIGGLSILQTETKSEAQEFAENDPFAIAGIRKETRVEKWRMRWVNGNFVGEAEKPHSS